MMMEATLMDMRQVMEPSSLKQDLLMEQFRENMDTLMSTVRLKSSSMERM